MAFVDDTFWRRLSRPFARPGESSQTRTLRQIESRRQSLNQAVEQWRSLLRELEQEGKTSEPRYESYYRAYLQAKEQEKGAELELFNLRQGFRG